VCPYYYYHNIQTDERNRVYSGCGWGSERASLAVARAIGLTGFICLSPSLFRASLPAPLCWAPLLSAAYMCPVLIVPCLYFYLVLCCLRPLASVLCALSSGRSVIRGVKWIFYFYYYDFIVFPVSVASLCAFVSLSFSFCVCRSHFVFPLASMLFLPFAKICV